MNFLQLAENLNPFMDQEGETYIEVEVPGIDRPEQIPLDTSLARDIVKAMLCSVVKRGFPTEQETRTAVDIIRGHAFPRPRRVAETSADYLIAKRPLAQAVLAVARKGGTKKPLPAMLATLNRMAQREGIDINKGPWPANEDSLGKQLSQMVALLHRKGVALVRNETDRPRTWTISPPSDGSVEPDGKVTDATSFVTEASVNPVTSQYCSGSEISDEQIQALMKEEEISNE